MSIIRCEYLPIAPLYAEDTFQMNYTQFLRYAGYTMIRYATLRYVIQTCLAVRASS
jgi:hypothetical protein